MDLTSNIDLLSVGITTAGTGILGFAIFFSDRKSITNRIFLYFSLATMFWGVVSFLNYNVPNNTLVLWIIRSVLFFAVFQAYFFFLLMYVFPERELKFSRWFNILLIPLILIAGLTLSPFLYRSIQRIPTEIVAQPVLRFFTIHILGNKIEIPLAMILFAVVAVGLVIAGVLVMIRKMIKATGPDRIPYRYLLIGIGLMFALIISFDFIASTVFNTTKYIPLSSLFTFPFILLTAITIYRHKAFNVKAVAVVMAAFIIAMFSFSNIIYAQSSSQIAVNITILASVIIGSIIIIRFSTALELRNEQISESMSFATHELRTPATAIKGLTMNALQGDLGPLDDEKKNFVQSIYIAGSSLVDLIGQYLNRSKLELDRLDYTFIKFNMWDLVKEVLIEMQPNAEFHKVTLEDLTNEGVYEVEADQGKLKEVVRNLVDNAIKYNKENGKVSLFVKKADDAILVQVKDTGVGIPENVMQHLYKKFSRADAQKRNLLGNGLGLFLAKIFIDKHNGKIWAESEVGKGTTFNIQLPVKQM